MSDELDEIMSQQASEAEEAFDLGDVEEVQIGPLAPGEYHCVVVKARQEVVKNGEYKGKPKFYLEFKPTSSNKRVFKHAILVGKPAGVTKSILRALGVDVAEPVRVSQLEGRHVWLTLYIRDDKPTENDISGWRAFEGDEDDAEAEDLK